MGVRAIGVCASVLVFLGTVVAACAWALGVPIPGITGPTITLPAALRTDDGGAILLGWIPDRPRADTGSTLTARVDAQGRLDLGYGYEGVAELNLGRAVTPTALAIDPATGDAWVGATDAGRSEILAIDGTGRRQRGFGHHGLVVLPRSDGGGVRALAWRAGALLIAAGTRGRCAGCVLTLLNAANGRPLVTTIVTPQMAGGPTCAGPVAVTSVAFGPEVLVATRVARISVCSASLLAFNDALAFGGPSPLPAQPFGSVRITPDPGAGCVAASGPAGIEMWPLGSTQPTEVATSSARLIALVPLGAGACGALIEGARGAAEVAQSDATGIRVTNLSRSLVPLAMFRCHAHLLVLAASGPAADEAAVIVPVPITRGQLAAMSAAAGTGCT